MGNCIKPGKIKGFNGRNLEYCLGFKKIRGQKYPNSTKMWDKHKNNMKMGVKEIELGFKREIKKMYVFSKIWVQNHRALLYCTILGDPPDYNTHPVMAIAIVCMTNII